MNIKSIPTVYGGVLMRSRLEARWAKQFELWNITWEYEVGGRPGWLPDFQLSHRQHSILCEVKPIDIGFLDVSSIRSGPFSKAILQGEETLLLGSFDRVEFPLGIHEDCAIRHINGEFRWTSPFDALGGRFGGLV